MPGFCNAVALFHFFLWFCGVCGGCAQCDGQGGVLTIVNKYGDPMNPVAGQNHVLYRGPLL